VSKYTEQVEWSGGGGNENHQVFAFDTLKPRIFEAFEAGSIMKISRSSEIKI